MLFFIKGIREEANFRMFFEKVRASKQKLETDEPKPPKKSFKSL